MHQQQRRHASKLGRDGGAQAKVDHDRLRSHTVDQCKVGTHQPFKVVRGVEPIGDSGRPLDGHLGHRLDAHTRTVDEFRQTPAVRHRRLVSARRELLRNCQAGADVCEPATGCKRKEQHPSHAALIMHHMDLAVEERGSGQRTVLLLHGLGASRDHLHEVADALDGRFASVLPDLRGHGDSNPWPVESIRDYVDDLLPVVRAAAPVAICGLSFGGDLARLLWNAEPDSVTAVVVVDPLLDVDALWRWAWTRAETRKEAYRQLISPYLEHDFERLVALMGEYPLTADLDEVARGRNARSHLRSDEATIQSTLRVLGKPEPLPDRPADSTARATLVRAARSPACPPPLARELAARLDAEVVTLDCGHCASLSEPLLLANTVAAAL
jgi:pimeloyl-ACP methyl ester carboxylesterase